MEKIAIWKGKGRHPTHKLGDNHIYSSGFNFFTYKMGELDYQIFTIIITETTTLIEVIC